MPDQTYDSVLEYAAPKRRVESRAAQLRMARGPNMAWRQFKRAMRRQLPALVMITTLFIPATLIHSFLTPLTPWLPIAFAWLGVALLVATVTAFAREAWRDAIGVTDFSGKKRRYAMLGAAPEVSSMDLRQLPPDRRSPLGLLAFQPASAFATAFRDLQHSLPARGVVAFIASAAGEGATTAAMCAAISATQQDKRVLLIDCDLRQRALTKALGLDPAQGVLEASESPDDWQSFVSEEEETGLHFIPAARPRSAWRGLAGTRGFEQMLQRARAAYDIVILDCPPAGTADGPIVARLADKNVVVAAWDHTPRAAIRETMRALRVRQGGAGVYVNRVPSGYRFGRLRAD
jgi:Mrp family chromosome partitioning ATPase